MKKISDINQGYILTFKANDGKYKALLCTSAYKEDSPHYFTLAALTYDDFEKPAVANILHCDFWGIGNRKDSHFKYSDIELNQMWTCHPEIKPYVLGSYGLVVLRKDFIKFRDDFEVIGNLKIVDNLDKNGNGGMNASDLNFIKDFLSDKINSILPDRGQKLFKLEAIVKDYK